MHQSANSVLSELLRLNATAIPVFFKYLGFGFGKTWIGNTSYKSGYWRKTSSMLRHRSS